jgi:hypothetical protein
VDYMNKHFPMATRRQNKNVRCLHGNNIETFLIRYLQIFIFFQIKKPFVICQPNIQVKKSKISLRKNPDLPPSRHQLRSIIMVLKISNTIFWYIITILIFSQKVKSLLELLLVVCQSFHENPWLFDSIFFK